MTIKTACIPGGEKKDVQVENGKIPVIIADDHELVRIGLRTVIQQSERFSVADEAQNGSELMKKLEEKPCQIVLLDLNMPKSGSSGGPDLATVSQEESVSGIVLSAYSGLLLLQSLKQKKPELKVLVITQHDSPEVIRKARDLGADGFVLKEEFNNSVIAALEALARGEKAFSSRVEEILSNKNQRSRPAISTREYEVLELIAHGFRDQEIADRLDITPRTVAFHKANLKSKLDADSTADLIAFYFSSKRR